MAGQSVGHQRLHLILAITLLLGLLPELCASAQIPEAARLLIRFGPVSRSQRGAASALDLNVLAEHEGVMTAIATPGQADALRRLEVDVVLLDDQASLGRYYVVPTHGAGADVARERGLATFPLSTEHVLLRVEAADEDLLRERSGGLKCLFGHLPWPRRERGFAAGDTVRQDLIQEMVDQVSGPALSEHVRNLQDHDSLPGWDALRSRYSFSPQLDVEKEYIGAHFADLGLTVEYQPFELVGYGSTVEIFNVVATLPGVGPSSDRIYVLCGHYDSTASRTSGWDWEADPAPGADDNASGTAAVMEAARVLSRHEFSGTVRFVAFAGEEQGLWGSSAYVANASAAGDNIRGVINLDMIGHNPACDKVDFLGDPASEWLVDAVRANAGQYGIEVITEKIISAGFRYSDHSSFWDYGYPAILGIEDYQPWFDSYCYETNHNYHKVTDTLSAMNLDLLEKTTKLVVGTVAELAGPESLGETQIEYLPLVLFLGEGSGVAP